MSLIEKRENPQVAARCVHPTVGGDKAGGHVPSQTCQRADGPPQTRTHPPPPTLTPSFLINPKWKKQAVASSTRSATLTRATATRATRTRTTRSGSGAGRSPSPAGQRLTSFTMARVSVADDVCPRLYGFCFRPRLRYFFGFSPP